MDRDEITKLVTEAWEATKAWQNGAWNLTSAELEAIAKLVAAAEREKAVQWMMQEGYATGHGDSIEDLLQELEWQVQEREGEACAQMVDDMVRYADGHECAAAIRSKGKQ